MKKRICSFLKRHTTTIVDENDQKFRLYPRWLIWFILFISYNVLVQGIADVVIKASGYTPWFRAFPARWDFLFLTAVSVLMGYQVLMGMRRRELDVTRNSFAVGILVESGLIVSDILHLIDYASRHEHLFIVRSPFIILTSINLCILLYIANHLRLFRNKKGEFIIT